MIRWVFRHETAYLQVENGFNRVLLVLDADRRKSVGYLERSNYHLIWLIVDIFMVI